MSNQAGWPVGRVLKNGAYLPLVARKPQPQKVINPSSPPFLRGRWRPPSCTTTAQVGAVLEVAVSVAASLLGEEAIRTDRKMEALVCLKQRYIAVLSMARAHDNIFFFRSKRLELIIKVTWFLVHYKDRNNSWSSFSLVRITPKELIFRNA